LELTPREHPDRLSTLSVLHATETMVHILQEVKRREENYKDVKDISARIADLPPAMQLASRERRLLVRGAFRLLPDGPRVSGPFQSYDSGLHSASSSSSCSGRWTAAERILADQREQSSSFGESLYMLVFMDLLVITKSPADGTLGTEACYLHDSVGISRILSAEQSGERPQSQ
jgi:hypothetical protein